MSVDPEDREEYARWLEEKLANREQTEEVFAAELTRLARQQHRGFTGTNSSVARLEREIDALWLAMHGVQQENAALRMENAALRSELDGEAAARNQIRGGMRALRHGVLVALEEVGDINLSIADLYGGDGEGGRTNGGA